MNERRNPTLCADNCFFSSSFHGFSRGDDSVAQRLWARLALNRNYTQNLLSFQPVGGLSA